MPHYCRICDTYKANERFSGKGHKTHICKKCQKKPKTERAKIEIISELYGFLQQSNISAKNIKRIKILAKHTNKEIAGKAALILEVARLRPHKRKRIKFLAKNHRDLLKKLEEKDLIFGYYSFSREDESFLDGEFLKYEQTQTKDLNSDLSDFEVENYPDELPF